MKNAKLACWCILIHAFFKSKYNILKKGRGRASAVDRVPRMEQQGGGGGGGCDTLAGIVHGSSSERPITAPATSSLLFRSVSLSALSV